MIVRLIFQLLIQGMIKNKGRRKYCNPGKPGAEILKYIITTTSRLRCLSFFLVIHINTDN
jgi:hypothetical protein